MLTTKQARENQEKYGFNELVEGKKKSTMQMSEVVYKYYFFFLFKELATYMICHWQLITDALATGSFSCILCY